LSREYFFLLSHEMFNPFYWWAQSQVWHGVYWNALTNHFCIYFSIVYSNIRHTITIPSR
jgi:hypothetical protein